MNPDHCHTTHTPESELDRLYAARTEAERKLGQAQREAKKWEQESDRLALLYRRQALWLRADELRRELAAVENEAANITLSGDTAPYPNDR